MARAARVAAVAALLFGLYLLIAGALFAVVVDRTLTVGPLTTAFAPDPKVRDPFALNYGGDPGKAFGLQFETVAIPTELGPAPAWWVPVAAPASPRVAGLYVHGIAGRRENGFRQLAALRDAGVPLLLISYRNDTGAPRSPDGRYNFGLTEWRDVEAAAAWLKAHGYDQILLMGESMGGGIVGQFLKQSPARGNVVALALDSPALDFRAVIRGLAEKRHLPAADAIAATAIGLFTLVRGGHLRDADVVATVAAYPGPLFLAHGTGDPIVSIGISDAMLSQRQGVSTMIRTRAGHLESWHENPDRYRRELARFAAGVR